MKLYYTFSNLLQTIKNPDISQLVDIYKGKTALIASAGSTLSENKQLFATIQISTLYSIIPYYQFILRNTWPISGPEMLQYKILNSTKQNSQKFFAKFSNYRDQAQTHTAVARCRQVNERDIGR